MKIIFYGLCFVVCLSLGGCRSGLANQSTAYTVVERNYRPLIVTKIHELNDQIVAAQSEEMRAPLVKERWEAIRRHVHYEGASGHHILSMAFTTDIQPNHPMIPAASRLMSSIMYDTMQGNKAFPSDLEEDYEFSGDTLHIKGDVTGSITMTGDSTNLVIGGNVKKGTIIETKGFADIYIGGDLEGDLILQSMSEVIVVGNVTGTITLNDSTTGIQLYGDLDGALKAGESRPSVQVKVHGFTPLTVLQQIMGENFMSIDGYFTRSDAPAGELPPGASFKTLHFKLMVESSTKDLG